MIRTAGELNKRVVFLFSDTQIQTEGFVEDISNILNTYEVPNLMAASDLAPIFENIRARAKAVGMDGNKDSLYTFFLQVSLSADTLALRASRARDFKVLLLAVQCHMASSNATWFLGVSILCYTSSSRIIT